MTDKTGMVHVYTGKGKGKTTAAVGLGVRAYGAGLRVLLVQFLKYGDSSELNSLRSLGSTFAVYPAPGQRHGFYQQLPETERRQVEAETRQRFEAAAEQVRGGDWDMVILDEMITAVSYGMVSERELCDLMREKAGHTELVLTGRGLTDSVAEAADLITEMKEIKHYYRTGVPSRPGIEK